MEWSDLIGPLKKQDYFQQAMAAVQADRANGITVFPPRDLIFNAFRLTPLNELKVVILGQDPYHEPGQAMGLSFSVPPGVAIPPSLRNIYKELTTDMPGFTAPNHGCLTFWATQGVLLLNAVLTVRAGAAGSHRNIGWQSFTNDVIRELSNRCEHLCFLLWGNYAREKKSLIDADRHLILEAAHPSPLSAHNGFFGCRHFSRANAYLHQCGRITINWQLPPNPD